MDFAKEGLEKLREKIEDDELKEIGKIKPEDFIRNRSLGFSRLIYYFLNKKGLCTGMEANDFFDKIGENEAITSQGVFSQRLKLNPQVFVKLNEVYLNEFYSNHKDEVKTYKGFVLKAIDGSDMEIPNTRACLEKYGMAGNHRSGVARAGMSACFDVLNHYVLDGILDNFRSAEIEMAMKHMERTKSITDSYDSIYIMDRNYVSIGFMTYMIENGIKFLCRLKGLSHYTKETAAMASDDEIIEIKHTKHRMQKSRFTSEEIFAMAKAKSSTNVRVIKYTLASGEIEYLITNIFDFTYSEIVELYGLRWGIETLYFSLKSKLKLEKFTSSITQLIEQDFFSTILAYNIIQSSKNHAEKLINQDSYKHEMKINENMAIGFVKNELILIMLEEIKSKRLELFDGLVAKIIKHKVPVRPNRHYDVNFKTDNNNSFNKLKSF